MAATLTKPGIVKAVEALPEDATLDDAIERLILLRKVEIGLQQIQAGQGIPHAEVEAWFEERRKKRAS